MSHTLEPGTTAAPAGSPVEARRRHYAEFYGLAPLPTDFGVVLGNCQGESLRTVMDAPDRRFVRVPAVHEMTPEDAERLHEVVGAAHTVVSQPVRDDYHDLPLGTRQVAASTSGRVLTVTPVRFGGLHPFQAAVRVPGVEENPPIVAYHDVRTLAAAAGLPVASALQPDAVRAIGRASVEELRRREAATDVPVSDLFESVTADHARTVNHPGNAIWLPLGARVLETLGAPGRVTDPGRPLLNAVRAPIAPEVVDAWSLTDGPRDRWILEGVEVDDAEVRAAHADWYASHPEFVVAAVDRLSALLTVWRNA
ncbi:WcbI family polysaccharide biosynthesis putative acetyltransferase [Plantibacter flavus]|uniref:WcbI family polysaccharide biosynthesis putative acetyltransferase n=1 Tax=Plantibacter flavus TaxID=150123 RepID=UPI0023792BA0|nr:WcbI family polysaccharide biosynthesis putative acetyltransferase [Plantibacter flavus]MDD9152881.1 WcbI family polysaccharide biosynthesis putative acetyltransferase [Plantibacter flavus]